MLTGVPAQHHFHYYFRYIAFFGWLCGNFPVQNILNPDPFRLKYKIFCPGMFYSMFINLLLFYTMYMNYGFQFYVKSYFHKLLKFLVYFMIARSLSSFYFCLFRHAKRAPRVIQLLDSFDRKRANSMVGKCYTQLFRVSTGIVAPIVTNLLLTVTYCYESKSLAEEIMYNPNPNGHLYFAGIAFGTLGVWHVLPPLYYIYFAIKIAVGFQEINDTIVNKGYTGNYFIEEPIKFKDCMGKALSDLRILHNLLSEATYALSKCYGSFIAINHLFLVVAVVINISAYVYATQDLHLIILTCIDVLYFLITIAVSQAIKKRGAKVARLFQGIPISALSERSKQEIELWLLQLSVHPVEVSAAGYFILDKSQTFEVLSSIATYLIVAVQLLQDEKSNETTTFNQTTIQG